MNLCNDKIKMLTSVFRSMWVFFIIRKKSEQNWSRQIYGCHYCISLLFLLGKLDYFQLNAMNLLPGDSACLSLIFDPFLSSMCAYIICISFQRVKLWKDWLERLLCCSKSVFFPLRTPALNVNQNLLLQIIFKL